MTDYTHEITKTGLFGGAKTLCGLWFPPGQSREPWFLGITCPDCKKARKKQGK